MSEDMAAHRHAEPAPAAAHADWLRPRFTTPGVGALMSTRAGGVSAPPWASLNLGLAVNDDPAAVRANRARFAAALGGTPVFLRQVHGTRVLRLPLVEDGCGADGQSTQDEPAPEADASFSTEPGIACVVQVADCLPVLMAAPGGRGVAAAHAGWRGLAAGVLEAAAAALGEAAGCRPAELEAWLGPCIGPRQFEVGEDVLRAFGATPGVLHARFVPGKGGRWIADLAGLARDRLAALGLTRIGGGGWCTVEDASRFFSYRRDQPVFGQTGRMAAAIWIERPSA